ncbi:MAG: hypothetical protein HKN26_14510 [Acidimicrobiales bacterium]|nr:hypothetical protein [Acidimicrobiales bacterium]
MSPLRHLIGAGLAIVAVSCASLPPEYGSEAGPPTPVTAEPGPAINDVVLTKVPTAIDEAAIPDPGEVAREVGATEQETFCDYLHSTALMVVPGESGPVERVAALSALASVAPEADQQFFRDVALLHQRLAENSDDLLAAAQLNQVLRAGTFTVANFQNLCGIDIVSQFDMAPPEIEEPAFQIDLGSG